MSPKKMLNIIETTEEDCITDEQVKALKELSVEDLRALKKIAQLSNAAQIILSFVAGAFGILGLMNWKAIIEWFR